MGEEGLMGRYLETYFGIAELSLRIAPQRETRRGAEVTKIVCGHGAYPRITFYVDEKRGFLPLEVVLTTDTGSRAAYLTEIRECPGGRWFPMRCLHIQDVAKDPLPAYEIKVTNLSLDERPTATDFQVELSEGFPIGRASGGRPYMLQSPLSVGPSGLEELRERVERVAAGLSADPPPPVRSRMVWLSVAAAAAIVLVALVMLRLRQKTRAARS